MLRGKCVEKSVGGGGSWAYILLAYALAEIQGKDLQRGSRESLCNLNRRDFDLTSEGMAERGSKEANRR